MSKRRPTYKQLPLPLNTKELYVRVAAAVPLAHARPPADTAELEAYWPNLAAVEGLEDGVDVFAEYPVTREEESS